MVALKTPKVLVDSSVWIRFFRDSHSAVATPLSHLVRKNQAWLAPIVRVELLSGARHEPEYQVLEERLAGLPMLPEPEDVWNQVACARFRLARLGIQAAIPDLLIAVTASTNRCVLWSLDQQFKAIVKVLPFQLYHP